MCVGFGKETERRKEEREKKRYSSRKSLSKQKVTEWDCFMDVKIANQEDMQNR